MTEILAAISSFLGAIKEAFGFQSKKLDLKNAADVRAAAARQAELDAVNRSEKAIANRDANEVRKEISE